MIQSAVTISLVPSLSSGPWIFWDPLEKSIPKAAEAGFDAIELFTADAAAVDPDDLASLLEANDLELAAVGTGAGAALQGLRLTDPDESVRQAARAFIRAMIDFAGPFGAPAIIGSMQGNIKGAAPREQAMLWLTDALEELADNAADHDVPLFFEPLNRYETDVVNRLGQGVEIIERLEADNVLLLGDLFHMNIEEPSIGESIRQAADYLGHVHFADSNRRPVGYGHTDMHEVARALQEIGYEGYASAEALPYPRPETAAAQTIKAFREYLG